MVSTKTITFTKRGEPIRNEKGKVIGFEKGTSKKIRVPVGRSTRITSKGAISKTVRTDETDSEGRIIKTNIASRDSAGGPEFTRALGEVADEINIKLQVNRIGPGSKDIITKNHHSKTQQLQIRKKQSPRNNTKNPYSTSKTQNIYRNKS